MRVEQSQQAELITAQAGLGTTAAKHAGKASFASVLAKSEKTTSTTGTNGSNTTTKTGKSDGAERADRAIPKGPKGEKTQAVKDHPAYVEITAGPRNGMFINMTNNERRGEAFTLIRKGDRDLHVYGTGKDRRVIISWHKDQPAHADEYKADGTKKSDGKTVSPSKTGGASVGS